MDNQDIVSDDFLKSLGFPKVNIHQVFTHFDFTKEGRRILLIGPMGSGKTEFSARIWRDAEVAMKKSGKIKEKTSTGNIDRRDIFFVRSYLDTKRFKEYPSDALAYRSGFVRCGNKIAKIKDSFDLETILEENPNVGTFIVDEASFFDERLAYVIRNHSLKRGVVFIFPTLILNFRRDIFNSTARLMLDMATDVIPLTAYCEHNDCVSDAFYTYRYYTVDSKECPALYFDPLIVIGGDKEKHSDLLPNYCSRCEEHHYLPGKEYTYFTLKPLGEKASKGDVKPLLKELRALKSNKKESLLYKEINEKYDKDHVSHNSLLVRCIAEKALMYLFVEQNLITEDSLIKIVEELDLDKEYMAITLSNNKRPVNFKQQLLKDLL